MFQGEIKELHQEILDSLGKNRICECFLVDVEFRNESLVIKSLKCLTNFIDWDYSAKPWSLYSHFSNFIHQKEENCLLSLKDHRFNRINDCTLTLLYQKPPHLRNKPPHWKVKPSSRKWFQEKNLNKSETVINACVLIIKQHWKKMAEIPQKCDFVTWRNLCEEVHF